MAKYNTLTKNVTPGAGLNGIWGPVSVGYSIYGDETQIDLGGDVKNTIKYQVQTYNVGLYLNSLILKYANLRLKTAEESSYGGYIATVQLYTASLTLGKLILTASKRLEDSDAPAFNYDSEQLEPQKNQRRIFWWSTVLTHQKFYARCALQLLLIARSFRDSDVVFGLTAAQLAQMGGAQILNYSQSGLFQVGEIMATPA